VPLAPGGFGAGVFGGGTYGSSALYGTAASASPSTGIGLGDASLRVLADYLQANLNAYGAALWTLVGGTGLPCNVAYLNDPREFVFVETYLPAIFVYRDKGNDGEAQSWLAQDYLEDVTRWTVVFVYPPAQQALQNKRDTFDNVVLKTIARAIEAYRDPSYVAPGDADIKAPTAALAATSIKSTVATAPSLQTYTGASLNGAIGAGAISPPRPVVVTLGGDPAGFTDNSTITIVGLDVLGKPLTNTVTVRTSSVPGALTSGNDFTAVTSVTVPAQLGAAGTLSLGTGARAGLGSLYLEQAGLEGLTFNSWKNYELKVGMAAGAPTRTYYALEMTLEAQEIQPAYVSPEEGPNVGTSVSFVRSDGSSIESANY
jgi:hypothetical protein